MIGVVGKGGESIRGYLGWFGWMEGVEEGTE